MNSIDSNKLYSTLESNAKSDKHMPSITYPFIMKSFSFSKTPSQSLSKESLDCFNLELDDSNLHVKVERQGSMASSIDAMSSKRPNDDSFLSYLRSESPRNELKIDDKGKHNLKLHSDDQLELVNFIPGAMIRKKDKSSDHHSAYSNESINTLTQSYLSVDKKKELFDSKHLEAKSNHIFDQYLKLLSNSLSHDNKEGTNSSYDMIQKLCLPKGLNQSDSLPKDIAKDGLASTHLTSDDCIHTETNELHSEPSIHDNILKQAIVNTNQTNLSPYFSVPNIYQQYNTNFVPYPKMLNGGYIAYGYPLNGVYPYPVPAMSRAPQNHGICYTGTIPSHPYACNYVTSSQKNINDLSSTTVDKGKAEPYLSIINIIRDQHECRNLQIQLERDPSIAHRILPQILQHFVIFCCDPFGNYLIQKVIECLNDDGLNSVIEMALENFQNLSLHNFGTRVIQRLIEIVNQIQIGKFTLPMTESIQSLYKNPNGIHVISKYVNKGINIQFVYDFIYSNIRSVSTNKDGCCLIQKILEYSASEQKVIKLSL